MLSKASDAEGSGSHSGEQRRIDFVVGIANMTFPGLMAVQSGFANLTAAGMRTTNVLNQGMRVLEASMMAAGGFAALGLGLATVEAMKFEKQMKTVQALIMDTADTPDKIKEKMNDLSKAAKEMAAKYGMAPTEVAKGLTVLGRAGVDTASDMNTVLEAAVKLAKIEGITVEEASKMTVQMITLFGGNYARDADKFAEILAHAANISTTSAKDIMTAMGQAGGAIASIWGQDNTEEMYKNASEVSAMIATLSQQGVSGAMSGTGIKSFVNYMAKDMPKSKKALAELGLSEQDLKDSEGNFKHFGDVLDLFSSRLTSKFGKNKSEWYSWFVRWGEPRQAQQYMKMMQVDPDNRSTHMYDKYNQKMQEEYDIQERVNVVMSSASESFNKMVSSMQVFMINVGSYMLPVLNAVAGVFGFLASNGITSSLVAFIALVGSLVLIFGGLAAVLRWVAPAFGEFKHMLDLVKRGKYKDAMEFGAGKDAMDKRVRQLQDEKKVTQDIGKARSKNIDLDGKARGKIGDVRGSAPGASVGDANRRTIRSLAEQCDRVHRFNETEMGMGKGKSQYPERYAASPATACHETRKKCIEKKKGLVQEEGRINDVDTRQKRKKLQSDKDLFSQKDLGYSVKSYSGTRPRVGSLGGTSEFWLDRTKNFKESAFAAQYYRGDDPLGVDLTKRRRAELRNLVDEQKGLERDFKKLSQDSSITGRGGTYRDVNYFGAGTRGMGYNAPNQADLDMAASRRRSESARKSMELEHSSYMDQTKRRAEIKRLETVNTRDAQLLHGSRISGAKKEYQSYMDELRIGEAATHANIRSITSSEKRMLAYERGLKTRKSAIDRIKGLPSSIKGVGSGAKGAFGGMMGGAGTGLSGLVGLAGGPMMLGAELAGVVALLAAPYALDMGIKSGQFDALVSPYQRAEKRLKTYGETVDKIKKNQDLLKNSTEGLRKEQQKYAVGSSEYVKIGERINNLTETQTKLNNTLSWAEERYGREKEKAKKIQEGWIRVSEASEVLEADYTIYQAAGEAQLTPGEKDTLMIGTDYQKIEEQQKYIESETNRLADYFIKKTGLPTNVSTLRASKQIKEGFDYEKEKEAASMGMKWDYDQQTFVSDSNFNKKIKAGGLSWLEAVIGMRVAGVEKVWGKYQRELRMLGPFGELLANTNEEGGILSNIASYASTGPMGIGTFLGKSLFDERNRQALNDQVIQIIKPIFNLDGKTAEEAQSILANALKGMNPGIEIAQTVLGENK